MSDKLVFFSALSILFPLSASLLRYKILGKEYFTVFIFFVFSSFIELIADILNFKSINNLWLGNIFSLAECFFWGIIIWQWLLSRKIRLFIVIFLAAFFIAWCYSTFFYLTFLQFNNYIRAFESFVFVLLSCFLLLSVSTDLDHLLFSNPKFWFSSGLLIYFSVNLIVFGTVNFVFPDHTQLMTKTWAIHSVTNILANLLFATGFLCIKQKAI